MISKANIRNILWYAGILAFLMGVFVRSFFVLNIFVMSFVALVCLVVILGMYIFKESSPWAILFVVVILLFSFGVARFHFAYETPIRSFYDKELGQEVVIEGVIKKEPKKSDTTTHLKIYTDEGVGVIAFAEHYPVYEYGDRVRVSGELVRPESFVTDTGRGFDYVSFLEKDGIYYQMFRPQVELLEHGEGNWLVEKLLWVKNKFVSSVSSVLQEPYSALVSGITVGKEESLGDELEREFRRTGIIHIVVLSGYNVTIVSEFFMRVFAFLPFVARSILGGTAILLFMLLTGASATIVRASIMAVLVIVARITGRVSDMIRLLMIAGVAMVIHNPYILAFDPSFQLSFLATLGLIYVAPLLEKKFALVPTKWGIREFAVATIATQIFVLPLLLYMTGEFSVVSVVVNMLVLPFIPLAMFGGLLVGVFGFFSRALGLVVGYGEFVLLKYVFGVVHFFSELPFATLSLPQVSFWMVVLLYCIYAGVLVYINKKEKPDISLLK